MLFGNSARSQSCGGTLVGDKYIVTAAHCTHGLQPGSLKVLIGDTILGGARDNSSFIIDVQSIKQHEHYSSRTTENDIAILTLAQKVNLTAFPNIKPLCLPQTFKSYGGKTGVVSGWGTVGSGLSLNAHLHEVTVNIHRDDECGRMSSYMTEDMICAGLLSGGKDSCQVCLFVHVAG